MPQLDFIDIYYAINYFVCKMEHLGPKMTDQSYSLSVALDDFRSTAQTPGFEIAESILAEGEVMVRVNKVALTANSVSYALAGKSGLMRFLDIFPAPEGRGHIPCWGFGDVVFSKAGAVEVGERLYGFFPIASHVILKADKITKSGFTDTRPHRSVIAPFYSEYSFARKEPGYAPEFEDNIMLFRPLFGTSFLLESYCEDNNFFDADRVIVSSASAKTSMGFGYLLRKNHADKVKAIGLTSARNLEFVKGLDCFDEVLTYDEADKLAQGGRAIFFDVAGNKSVLSRVHDLVGDAIAYSGQVGQTHWDNADPISVSEGATPVFWSGPDQLMTLRKRLGPAGMMNAMQGSMVEFLMAAYSWIKMLPAVGPDAVEARVQAMLDGNVNADEGVILAP